QTSSSVSRFFQAGLRRSERAAKRAGSPGAWILLKESGLVAGRGSRRKPWFVQSACFKEVTMLVLSRKPGEEVVIDDNITIVVVEIKGNKVRLGIEAPKSIPVVRQELLGGQHEPADAELAEPDLQCKPAEWKDGPGHFVPCDGKARE